MRPTSIIGWSSRPSHFTCCRHPTTEHNDGLQSAECGHCRIVLSRRRWCLDVIHVLTCACRKKRCSVTHNEHNFSCIHRGQATGENNTTSYKGNNFEKERRTAHADARAVNVNTIHIHTRAHMHAPTHPPTFH